MPVAATTPRVDPESQALDVYSSQSPISLEDFSHFMRDVIFPAETPSQETVGTRVGDTLRDIVGLATLVGPGAARAPQALSRTSQALSSLPQRIVPLVRSISRRYSVGNPSMRSDAIQEALRSYTENAANFGKPIEENLEEFANWIYPKMQRDVKRWAQSINRIVPPSEEFLDKAQMVRAAQDKLRAASAKYGGFEPSSAGITKYLNRTGTPISQQEVEDVLAGIDRPNPVSPFQTPEFAPTTESKKSWIRLRPIPGGEQSPRAEPRPELSVAPDVEKVFQAAGDQEKYQLFDKALGQLDPKDRELLLAVQGGQSVSAIARQMGVRQQRLAQQYNQALDKIRSIINELAGEPIAAPPKKPARAPRGSLSPDKIAPADPAAASFLDSLPPTPQEPTPR
jgi:RNA polymerase sigma factor (sigma-70 family)